MEKLTMHSPDLTQANIDKVAELFPTVVTEAMTCTERSEAHTHSRDCYAKAIDFDLFRQELSDQVIEGPQERYKLDWPGKREALFAANAPIAKTLRPVREESVDFDTTKNIFIEGDNLDALKLLQENYLGKVKLIYIDPPYNTGNDFVYHDAFAESTTEYLERSGQREGDGGRLVANPESNGRFHSDWLSMMYPRLKLARNLLSGNGVIAISIGDEEVSQLRLLCDEVFGAENYVAQITVEMSTTQGMKVKAAQNGAIVKNCEWILLYARSSEFGRSRRTPLYDSVAGWPGNFGQWLHDDLTFEPISEVLSRNDAVAAESERICGSRAVRTADLGILQAASPTFRSFVETNLSHIVASDKGVLPAGAREPDWREGQAFEVVGDSRSYIVFKSSRGTIRQFLRLSDNYRVADDYERRFGRTVIRGDLWKGFYSDMAHVSLEGDTPFENGKKPTRLIENLIKWSGADGDSIILDFFAGSGTTGHAVMNANVSDGATRRYILVQLPEAIATGSSLAKGLFGHPVGMTARR